MKTIQTITLAFLLVSAVTNAQNSNIKYNTKPGVATSLDSILNTKSSEAQIDEGKNIECSVPATPGTITGTPEACFGFLSTYSIAPVPGATSYSWSVAGGAIQSSTGTRITVRFGHGGRSVSVRAANSCGLSAARTKAIIVVNCFPPAQDSD